MAPEKRGMGVARLLRCQRAPGRQTLGESLGESSSLRASISARLDLDIPALVILGPESARKLSLV